MNYNTAELCKDCKMPVEKIGFNRPYTRARSRAGENTKAQLKMYKELLKKAKDLLAAYRKFHTWPDTQKLLERDIDIFEKHIKRGGRGL